jgi:GT2 family glycosyltransferase
MKLAIGFIAYNNISAKYLPYFLPSLKEAVLRANLKDTLILSFNNSFEKKGIRSDRNINNEIVKNFKKDNPSLNLEILEFGENLGFSAAYNKMIAKAKNDGYDYFLVINPDTFLEESSIKEMLKTIEEDNNIASVSPKILVWDFENNNVLNKIDSLGLSLEPGLRFKDIMQGKDDRENNKLEEICKNKIIGPSGAAGLFKIEALEKVAILKKNNKENKDKKEKKNKKDKKEYFDERFFMYKEDCDLAYRLFLNGFKCKNNFNSLIFHDRSIGDFSANNILTKIKNRKKNSKKSRKYSFVNQHLLYIKYFKKQIFKDKIKIILRIFFLFIFSLIFEQFLLKEYKNILKLSLRK